MKLQSILCAAIIFGLTACSGDATSISASDVPEGNHWQVTVDGGTPTEGTKVWNQHVSGRLILMLTGKQFATNVSIFVPMEKQHETGVFEEDVELVMRGPGISDHGTCEHKPDSDASKASVSVHITQSSRELFIATFTFSGLECKEDAAVLSGSGVITGKRAAKK